MSTGDAGDRRELAPNLTVVRPLGKGTFGQVFECVDTRTGAVVAAKMESVDADVPQLAYEHAVLWELVEDAKLVGFPRTYWLGTQGGFVVMVMDLLGASVETLRDSSPGGMLPLALVKDVALQTLQRLRDLHSLGLVHRDLKPENLMYGVGDRRDTLFLIDFGLCKRVVDPDTGEHIPFRDHKGVTGTTRYASLFTHDGMEHSLRDDIECLGYVLVFLAKGKLPWQRLKGGPEAVGTMKAEVDVPRDLCRGLPRVFADTILHARGLAYGAKPDYGRLMEAWRGVTQRVASATST